QPSVGYLGGKRHILGADCCEVDRYVRAQGVQNQLEGFAEARSTPQRNVVILAMVFEGPVASQDPANNFHILARAHQRPAVRNAVPAFNYLRTRDTEAQE